MQKHTRILHHIRKLLRPGGVADSGDAQLLKRFVLDRDESAFEALVRRYGPLVLGLCRRVLRDDHDAEDAFQATFLVLMRKARRRAKSNGAAAAGKPEPSPERGNAAGLLDDELSRLPDRYRAPLVLCYLEGLTNGEAARQLGCPEGTVWTRLSRGRELLRHRLARRGVTLS
jgi:DNA-directed RNA polymerase specialized sigma24 family protein